MIPIRARDVFRIFAEAPALAIWKLRRDGRTFSRGRLDFKTAAHHFDSFPHADQAQPLAAAGQQYPLHFKRFSVVIDFHGNAVRQFLDGDGHARGFRVPGHIRERLLGHAIEHGAPGGVQLLHRRKGGQAGAHARPGRE